MVESPIPQIMNELQQRPSESGAFVPSLNASYIVILVSSQKQNSIISQQALFSGHMSNGPFLADLSEHGVPLKPATLF
jgi:hypothetical protein